MNLKIFIFRIIFIILFPIIHIPFIRKTYLIEWFFNPLFYSIIFVVYIVNIIDIVYLWFFKKYNASNEIIFKEKKFCILVGIKKILTFIYWFGIVKRLVQIFNIFRKLAYKKARLKISQNEQDMAILVILFVLSCVLRFFQCWDESSIFSCIVVVFVVWRLIDILSYQLSIIFTAKENGVTGSSFPRTIALFLVNVSEIILIYSILYLRYKAIFYYHDTDAIDEPLEALYFSITTISTTGFGEMIPEIGNRFAEFLVLSEISVGILLLVIFFGVIVSRWESKNDRYDRHYRYYKCRYYQLLRKFVNYKRKK